MKTFIAAINHASRRFGWLLVLSCLNSNAAVYTSSFTSGFANGGVIPDATTTGWSDVRTLAVADNSIQSITVTLNVSGGFNGDLYAYISHNGVLVPLMNRVGVASSSPSSSFGYSDPGFTITLSSAAANDVHFYGRNTPSFNGSGQLTGTWQPDGRTISPLSSPASFDSASRINFSAYNTLDPNGSWTLFFADVSGGGGTSTLTSWQLDITAVPEPVDQAFWVFVGLMVIVGLATFAKRAMQAWACAKGKLD